jgi:hypothetical protein
MTLRDDAAARVLLERALAIREQAFGPNHPEVASGLFSFGNFLRETNDFSSAQRAYERAFAIQESALGPTHPAVAATLTKLAVVFSRTGNYAAALPCRGRRQRPITSDSVNQSPPLYSLLSPSPR